MTTTRTHRVSMTVAVPPRAASKRERELKASFAAIVYTVAFWHVLALARDDSENTATCWKKADREMSWHPSPVTPLRGEVSGPQLCRSCVTRRAHFPRPTCSGAIIGHTRACAAQLFLIRTFFFLYPLAYFSTSSLLFRRLRDYGTTFGDGASAGIECSLRCPLAQCRALSKAGLPILHGGADI